MAKKGPAITGLHSQGISDIARGAAKAAAKLAMSKSAKATKAKAAQQAAAKKAAASAKKSAQDNAYEKMLKRKLSNSPTGTVSGSEIMDMGRRANSYYKK
jgi:hypothetical protein